MVVLLGLALGAEPLARVLAVAGDHFALVLVFHVVHYLRVDEVGLGGEGFDSQANQVPALTREGAQIKSSP